MRVCISRVQDVTGQLAGEKLPSLLADVTMQGFPPTMTKFSEATAEKAWPTTVSVSPSLPVAGEVETSTGVSASA